MEQSANRAIAIVGVGAILPEAPNVAAFWKNVKSGRYCITDVPPDRWDPALYYDPDRSAPDKTYSKIGGWVRDYPWEPLKWRIAIPPRVVDAMDHAQRWGIACTREALADYGYPERPLNTDRTAVILGNAMAGEKHYFTALRAFFPEYARELDGSPSFAALPEAVRRQIKRDWHDHLGSVLPPITEDSMPGELANCLAGRIANLYNFHGPNFVCDAACASAMAAVHAAVEGLIGNEFDVAVTGGIDRNMGASSFIKFSKIGALSGTGSRPYAEGADGFVMGEGAAIFLVKRLADAERDGDKIYAVVRGIGGSSDGKGKGITAPNPIGQKICIARAWENAGLSPATATLIEGHGTSTSVGDVVEVESMAAVLREHGPNGHPIALGSVKSNIGHLKAAAGAAGILKTVLALHEKVLPPSVRCEHPNPNIDFAHSPLYVNTELRPWSETVDGVRRAGASAFGFGGTNFHVVLEEYIPHRLTGNGKRSVVVGEAPPVERVLSSAQAPSARLEERGSSVAPGKAPLRGALVAGAASEAELGERLRAAQKAAEAGRTPAIAAPSQSDLRAPERIAIDYGSAAELADKCGKALKALATGQPAAWKALRAQGIFCGHGPAPKTAFLYTGQGSQYANMLRALRASEPIVARTFDEADVVLTPLLGKPLTEFVFVDPADGAAVARAEEDLRQTAITQPAVLATDLSLTRLLEAYGIRPDMTMGHSLGEYGALVAAGALPFADALEAVSARGREMTRVSMADNGKMAAVFAPLAEIERILKTIDGYVVIANLNSGKQAVIGGATRAVEQAIAAFLNAGYNVVPLPVSHAFHTSIVGPASEPLRRTLERLQLRPPRVPVVANVDGTFYPMDADARGAMLDILARQIFSPVQFVQGLQTLFDAGARVFVEVGPKKALHGFVEEVLGDRPDVLALFTNHPKFDDATAFNQALCGLYASGLGSGAAETRVEAAAVQAMPSRNAEPIVITGAALGLPGTEHIFDDGNLARLLNGQGFIDLIPTRFRKAMLDKHIKRLVKSDNGGPVFEEIRQPSEVVKLAGRGGAFDIGEEFGLAAERVAALDRVTALAIGAGIDALRDAGIPLTQRYKSTTKGTRLPDRWGLPDALRDETGVIFASVWPGFNSFAEEAAGYYGDKALRDQLAVLEDLRQRMNGSDGQKGLRQEVERRITGLQDAIAKAPYQLDRRFLFRVLSMGHSQFAELIGARGPNTQVNCACASTTLAVGLAEDWIHSGRCRRVIIVSADDITSDHLIEWFGSGFLASGAAATDDVVEDAAIPFDRRRHGMIIGMGAASLVVESAAAAAERGLRPICEVIGTVTANSAFHGTRLDIQHIRNVMEELVRQAESKSGVARSQFAPSMVFVSHETYTPARGGSASAEINALRGVFGDDADKIIIANTKGLTGHAMGAGIEDVVAVKALETGIVPPVANFKEVDPELGQLNLSRGGCYPVEYALRLGAGFGSQISMTLTRRVAAEGPRPGPTALGFATRIADRELWQRWLDGIAGYKADLEVVHRTLRVRDGVAAAAPPAPKPEVKAAAPEPPRAAESPAVPVSQPVASDAVVEAILNLVAGKTGYPNDMLSLDLDLEADLGIDTVKQAEMFAAVRETYHIPRDPDLKLRDFPTLQHVIQFVRDRRPPEPQVEQISGAADRVTEAILEMVAGKTGYPKDMLSLDLDLEADLGIDTVKQAEMFAAVRETYHIPRDPDLKLRDFPTLQHVIQFVRDRRPREAASPEVCPTPEPQVGQTSGAAEDRVTEAVLEMVAAKTGYPKDMLDLDLDLEADLGIDTVKQAEMFASIRETYNIPRNPDLKLRDFPTLKHVIQFARDRSPKTEPAVLEAPAVLATPAEAPAAPAAESVGNTVLETLLDLVAEKTGYPKDMLDLDLDLEADLGVDTVKQAEIFASIRETYQIPRDPDLKLRDFPTLKHVLQFVRDRSPHQPGPAAEAPIPPVETAQASTPPDTVLDTVLDLVAEKTGYPKDMLDLDLDMEADLGIDTVKQAEMFASIRETYRIPRDPDLKLRDFPTLKHVLQFVQDRRPAVEAATPDAVPPSPPPAAPLLDLPFVSGRRPTVALAGFEAAERIPRRVPVPVLRPPLGLFKPTGVVLGRGTRVFLAPDRGGVAAALSEKLNALGVEVVSQDRLADGPIAGVYWLPALDDEGDLSAMTADRWRDAVDRRVKSLYRTMRSLYPQIAVPGTFLVSATRMGGRHGYDAAGAAEPLGGAVTGFTKAHKRERPDAMVKAVDFETALGPAEIADILIEETLRDPAMVEIGHAAGLRWTVGLDERAVEGDVPGMVLDGKTVFCVTGAAGSIVSAITADLASASGGTFHLLDLVPEPDPADPDLQRYETDREGLKRDLFARIQARGQRATPALVEKDLAALERAQAACRAIEAVRAAGGTAHYYSVDLTDAEAMAKVMGEVRRRSGGIDVLVHAAGIERSHMLPDKEPREFDTVFDVKAGGCFHLLRAIGDMPLRTIVLFSSIAGRFGNGGQTDYSAANDFLCKVASNFRRGHPESRAIAIDWTAWGGIGMASRGSIPKVMEMAGIEMLSPEAGVPWIRRELTAGGSAAEVLAGGALGMLLPKTDACAGLDGAREPKGVMTSGTVRNGPRGTLTFETILDPAVQPFLRDHAIDGTPVLPGVMGVEAFAEAALSFAPGWSLKSIEDVEFLSPFKFYRNEPRSVFVEAEFHLQDGDLVARCRVLGSRFLFNQADPQTTTHFTGSVRLVREPAAGNGTSVAMALSEPAIEASVIYRTYFHGPAYQVLKRAWYGPDCAVGEMASGLPDHHHPPGRALALRPLWIELCFQTAGIWEMSVQHRMGLPRSFDRLVLYRAPGLVKGPVNAVVKPDQAGEGFQAAVVDAAGDCFLQIEGYRTVTFREIVDVNALHAGEPVTA